MKSNLRGNVICPAEQKVRVLFTHESVLLFTDSPFDLERCGPAVDLALERVNEEFLKSHKIQLKKVQEG